MTGTKQLLVFAKQRLAAFREELARLEHSEFPYPAAEAALQRIKHVFTQHAQMLNLLGDTSDPNTANQVCRQQLSDLWYYLSFLGLPRTRFTHLDVLDELDPKEADAGKLAKTHYVPFHQKFILHPKDFVLAVTLEWLRLPSTLAGYVVGRSSWGRRGLIIATAAGVHPGFTGCLTLELSNVGEVPIALVPGITICQVFFHRVESTSPTTTDRSAFLGSRKPGVGIINRDEVALRLAELPRPT